MSRYLHLTISAETTNQADTILKPLLENKLVTGGQIMQAPARFLWKGEATDMNYVTIHSFTKKEHQQEIISLVEENSVEEVPMVTFTPFEGNQKLHDWIDKTLVKVKLLDKSFTTSYTGSY